MDSLQYPLPVNMSSAHRHLAASTAAQSAGAAKMLHALSATREEITELNAYTLDVPALNYLSTGTVIWVLVLSLAFCSVLCLVCCQLYRLKHSVPPPLPFLSDLPYIICVLQRFTCIYNLCIPYVSIIKYCLLHFEYFILNINYSIYFIPLLLRGNMGYMCSYSCILTLPRLI